MALARTFYKHSVTAHKRAGRSNEAGTLQPDIAYADVAGMARVEVSFQPMSSMKIPTPMGITAGRAARIFWNPQFLPAGAEVKEGDRVTIAKKSDGTVVGTYTIKEAMLHGFDMDEIWACLAEREHAAGV